MKIHPLLLVTAAVGIVPHLSVQQGCGPDFDGDGYSASQDCDEQDIAVHDGAPELCDGKDNDCNEAIDDSCAGQSLAVATDRLLGTVLNGDAGSSVAGIGDINDDGLDDLVVAASYEPNGGRVYVVPGPVVGEQDLGSQAWLTIEASQPYEYLGQWLEVADMNADGRPDLILNHSDDEGTTSMAVFFSPFARGTRSVTDADLLVTSDGSMLSQEAPQCFRDMTGDGVVDVVFWYYEPTTMERTGYLFAGPLSGPLDPHSAVATFQHDPEVYDTLSVMCGGDVSGDGVADLVLVNTESNYYTGEISVFFGPIEGDYRPAQASATIHGDSLYNVGFPLLDDDLNGDGLADLLVPTGSYDGATGAVLGVYGPFSGDSELAAADIQYLGEDSSDEAGRDFAFSDLDGDGQKDFVVGAPFSDKAGWGRGLVYLVPDPQPGMHSLGDERTFYFGEVDFAMAGAALAPAGDVNGDGHMDLIVGDASVPESTRTGTIYVLYGPLLP